MTDAENRSQKHPATTQSSRGHGASRGGRLGTPDQGLPEPLVFSAWDLGPQLLLMNFPTQREREELRA